LFQDVYEWAGEFRTTDIRKGLDQAFAPKDNLTLEIEAVADLIRQRAGSEMDDDELRPRFLADVLGRVNYAHPFREGNGRTQRAFAQALAADHGWELEWESVSQEENDAMFIASMRGDFMPLRQTLARVVVLAVPRPDLSAEAGARDASEGYVQPYRRGGRPVRGYVRRRPGR